MTQINLQTQINLLAMKGWVQYGTPFLPRLIVHIGNQSCAKKSMTETKLMKLSICLNHVVLIKQKNIRLAGKFADFSSSKKALR